MNTIIINITAMSANYASQDNQELVYSAEGYDVTNHYYNNTVDNSVGSFNFGTNSISDYYKLIGDSLKSDIEALHSVSLGDCHYVFIGLGISPVVLTPVTPPTPDPYISNTEPPFTD